MYKGRGGSTGQGTESQGRDILQKIVPSYWADKRRGVRGNGRLFPVSVGVRLC